MRNRGCPATGRMMHNYDKVTHRCKGCHRWQAGFKPKTEPKTPRAECQICEGSWALTAAGDMVHHGYKRPGVGFIMGDCMGVGCKPYPATDALARYKMLCERTAAGAAEQAADHEAATELEYHGEKRDIFGKNRQTFTVTIRKGDEYTYTAEYGSLPGFAYLQAQRIRAARARQDEATREAKRAAARIERAEAMTTGAVECAAS